jgi:hypothetical protein
VVARGRWKRGRCRELRTVGGGACKVEAQGSAAEARIGRRTRGKPVGTARWRVLTPKIGTGESLLTVNSCIKVRLDLQADKSPVVVKGPFFPRVVNPRYRIRGTMCNARIQSSKAR